ncbi:hypothetical protein Bca52824_006786 [Brassica carinata]|uniref:Uncharacterized protein n=1 Tax=Brassica carinata TaxID=52824 RepID=A0A8X7W8Q2_BRACI|nr:hypothetical protein Bca52824_006786 [Brassica carinata]
MIRSKPLSYQEQRYYKGKYKRKLSCSPREACPSHICSSHFVDNNRSQWKKYKFMSRCSTGRKVEEARCSCLPITIETMQQQREISMKKIVYLLEKGVFQGWLIEINPEAELKKFALHEICGMYDYSLSAKLGIQFLFWGNAVKFFGTKRHHEKWLRDTEDFLVKGCFAMTETEEFVIKNPCESAQKYWIGEVAIHATHAVVISQLKINGTNQGIHVFVAQIRDQDGNICPNIRIADCGHKIGLNAVDNGRIW